MPLNPALSIWKGLRTVLLGALAVGVVSALEALAQALSGGAVALPGGQYTTLLILGLLDGLRNALKNWK